jgi:hypothetical protein
MHILKICIGHILSPLLVSSEIVNNGIDGDSVDPRTKGDFLVIFIKIGDNLQKSCIEQTFCVFPITGIPQANSHKVSKALLIKRIMRFSIILFTRIKKLGIDLHTLYTH